MTKSTRTRTAPAATYVVSSDTPTVAPVAPLTQALTRMHHIAWLREQGWMDSARLPAALVWARQPLHV